MGNCQAALAADPIRFITFDDYKKLGRTPRYPDDIQIVKTIDNFDMNRTLFIFISHNWLRGWSGAPGYDNRPHPDNATHEKYKLTVIAIEKIWKELAPLIENVAVWIDYGCINQDKDPAGELKQLNKIIELCDCILTPIYEDNTSLSAWSLSKSNHSWFEDYKAAAWNSGPYSYLNRAWCRVEMLYAANIPIIPKQSNENRLRKFEGGLKVRLNGGERPHILFGTKQLVENYPLIFVQPLQHTWLEKYEPRRGCVTKQTDKQKIDTLMKALSSYIDDKKAVEGLEQLPDGKVRYTFKEGDVYEGEIDRNGLWCGNGIYCYSNGDMYVGQYKGNKRNGTGTLHLCNGSIFNGNFKDDKFHTGTYIYSNGDKYIGEFLDNMPYGDGTYIMNGGMSQFKGHFRAGDINGKGTLLEDGVTTEGYFKITISGQIVRKSRSSVSRDMANGNWNAPWNEAYERLSDIIPPSPPEE